MLDQRRYPIGKFDVLEEVTSSKIHDWINTIESQPHRLSQISSDLSDKELKYQYRPEGWDIRQVIHHVADSHINSFVRYKWTLTEETPIIKAYDEAAWSQLPDYSAPIEVSLSIFEALHRRWILLLRQMSDSDFKREFIHPETKRHISLGILTSMYAWHGNHHIAHVELALKDKIVD